MNFTVRPGVAQPLRVAIIAAFLASPLACGGSGGGGTQVPPPAEPESAVRAFLSAVSANSLVAMGQLWGSSRGPAAASMDRTELDQRLTVIRIYLEHESYDFVPPDPTVSVNAKPNERVVWVRLSRRGCTPVVPFTVTPYRSGWLIRQIDLAAAGNPARACSVPR